MRLYESLCSQQCQDFEWLVVDDGSTDGTDAFIPDLVADGKISISFIRKENGGKHTAHNVALKYAKGEYFFTVDSDDWLPDDAVLKINEIVTNGISAGKSENLAGFLALKTYENGMIISSHFSRDNFISSINDLEQNGDNGERSMIFRTSVLKDYPFPVIEGEKFMTESVIYDRIDQKYNFLVVNDVLTICEYQEDGLSSNPKRLMYNNPGGYAVYFSQRADISKNNLGTIIYLIQANCFRYLYRGSQTIKKPKKRLLYSMLRPLGWVASFHYKKFAR